MNKSITLSQITTSIFDGKHGDCENLKGSGLYFISVKDLSDYNINYYNAREITPNDFEQNYKRTNLEEGDTIYANTGDTIGKSIFVKNNKLVSKTSFQKSIAVLKPNINIIEPRYLYYLMKYETPRLRKVATGSGQKNLLLSTMRDFKVTIHDRKRQKQICSLLGLLDDKIEINNKINDELENMAKTIYDYWFLQFEFPNEEGKPYKSSGGKMVWNEELKREIPEGWKVNNILNVCDVVDCLHSKKPTYCKEYEDYYLLTLENLTEKGYIDLSKKYYISKTDYEKWTSRILVKENDFVVTNAGRAGDIGKIPYGVKCAIGRNLTAIRPKNINPYYLRQFFKSNYLKEQVLSNLDCGSFFMSFNVKSIKSLNVLIPNEDIMKKSIDILKPIILKIENNIVENQELTSLRDFLLPLLMNGQVGFKGDKAEG